MIKDKKIIITGAAGFIGFHVCMKLLEEGATIFGFDNLNDYYNIDLKKSRLKLIEKSYIDSDSKWFFSKGDLEDKDLLDNIFKKFNPNIVIHLGAQAGVRYSIENPSSYIESNIKGFANILECCRNANIENLIYASSSSVYGSNKKIPFSENDSVDHPVSLYAATKKSNELMAHAYSNLYNLNSIGLRFFTVYGPWGRPDMAPMIFANAILKEKPIQVFNNGEMHRDFTYISDVVEAIYRLCFKGAVSDVNFDRFEPTPSTSFAPHMIFNIGNEKPVNLIDFIEKLELYLGKKAIKIFKPMQPGDVETTFADTTLIQKWIDFKPKVSIDDGLKMFSNWYKKFYKF